CVDEPSRSATEGRSSEGLRAVATCSVSGVRESEDVREGERHPQEFLDPDRSPRRGRYTLSTLNYTVHLLGGRTNERLVNSHLKMTKTKKNNEATISILILEDQKRSYGYTLLASSGALVVVVLEIYGGGSVVVLVRIC
ncbi:hypothetical protein T05_370, partial [Trichinella murrelli]